MANILRKATATLQGTVSGHKELAQAIATEKNKKDAFHSWTVAQTEAAGAAAKWASQEPNPALQDVFNKAVELDVLWAEAQRQFENEYREYRKALESVVTQEKALEAVDKNRRKWEKEEQKCKQDLEKSVRRGENTSSSESKLEHVTTQMEAADTEFLTAKRDTEQYKSDAIKSGLASLADAYVSLFEKGIAIFKAQKELAAAIPDKLPHMDEDETYIAADFERTAHFVKQAKDSIRKLEGKAPPPLRRTASTSTDLGLPPPRSSSISLPSVPPPRPPRASGGALATIPSPMLPRAAPPAPSPSFPRAFSSPPSVDPEPASPSFATSFEGGEEQHTYAEPIVPPRLHPRHAHPPPEPDGDVIYHAQQYSTPYNHSQ